MTEVDPGQSELAQGPQGGSGDTFDRSPREPGSEGGPSGAVAGRPSWREVWQVPLLGLGVIALGAAIVAGVMTTPKPDMAGPLAQAEALLDDERAQEAIDLLNERVFPFVERGRLGVNERKAYHLLIARGVFLGQKELGISVDVNNETIVREYAAAEQLGEKLDPRDLGYLAETYLAMGRLDETIRRAERLVESDPGKRRALYKAMIERELARPDAEAEQAMAFLTTLLGDQNLPASDRAWAMARQAHVLIETGYPDEAIIKLLRSLPRMVGSDGRELAELYLLLGRAYAITGRFDESARNLERASELLSEGDTLRGELLALEGEGLMRLGRTQEARDKFLEIRESFSGARTYLKGLLGLGEAEGELGRVDQSIEAFEALVRAMAMGERSSLVTRDEVSDAMLRQHRSLMSGRPGREASIHGETDAKVALKYAELAEALYPPDEAPTPVIEALALTHRTLAEELLPSREGVTDPAMDILGMDRQRREEARKHLRMAGLYARMRTARVVGDAGAYAEALWSAADAYDRAGDEGDAIAALLEFVESFPSDGRHAEARFRLGVAYQARGEYERAAEVFRSVISDRDLRELGVRVGPYADASYVPLAQCLILDGKSENDAEAEAILLRVVDGTMTGTGAAIYTDAVVELAGLYDRAGQWTRAIERYTEVIERYPEDARFDLWRFRLADACRKEAERISEALRDAMPDADRLTLEQSRRARLQRAIEMYDAALDSIERKDPRRRRSIESLYVRNSYFYLGDCSFDLGDFDDAIRRYEAARERYPNDPASLVAMVQIVNTYVERKDYVRAMTANERARRFYESLPESVWDDPNLPMSRQDWERWLDATSRLYAMERGE